MDILARIEQVIKEHGTNKTEVAERMGKAKQNFKSLLTNPKWDSLELFCQAMGIQPWQLFEQEIREAGYTLAAPSAGPESASSASSEQQPSAGQAGRQQPLEREQEQEQRQEAAEGVGLQQAIVCPHCQQPISIMVK